eukprot:637673-Ditylum_brightwellii.AAC.1
MKAELEDLCNMIAKLNPQANQTQPPLPSYQQQYQAPPAPPQEPPTPFMQQPSYVWNGQDWTMAPPMPFQNPTNTQGLQPYKKQKKLAQKAIAGLMDGAGIRKHLQIQTSWTP